MVGALTENANTAAQRTPLQKICNEAEEFTLTLDRLNELVAEAKAEAEAQNAKARTEGRTEDIITIEKLTDIIKKEVWPAQLFILQAEAVSDDAGLAFFVYAQAKEVIETELETADGPRAAKLRLALKDCNQALTAVSIQLDAKTAAAAIADKARREGIGPSIEAQGEANMRINSPKLVFG